MTKTAALHKEQTEAKTTHFKKGSRVQVDFISDSRTEFSGIHIKGDAVVDRHEDGYVYGQLELGTPFMCPESFAQPIHYNHIQQMRVEFEQWLKGQKEFSTLVYQHGSDVLIYDAIDGYKILAVALAFELWKKLDLFKQRNWILQGVSSALATSTQRGGDHG
ncbi:MULTISPECIES: hypothetical protein [unclassified Acinetobacter]|uniref:hypothetical protein n=1 Tax=unclassified Acinetobacter TaxID=196816 RepID=UPI00124CE212|nr:MULTISPECIES: hypothetical protein [unclassified Acinetobacter]